jgi:hypothetical protein
MTLDEIKAAVDAGRTVHWANTGYRVVKWRNGEYVVHCDMNEHCIGLTWKDGTTVNGTPEQFFIKE